MIIDHEREKLLNVIIYFALNTKNLGKVKLFKLLHFLDFQHYRDVGRPVTGLQYHAWPKGPVPVELENEVYAPKPDMCEKVSLEIREFSGGNALKITPRMNFDPTHFSKRELRMMEQLATEFKNANADAMIERTHLEHEPWHEIYNVRNRPQALIPYELAARSQESETMSQIAKERDEVLSNFASV